MIILTAGRIYRDADSQALIHGAVVIDGERIADVLPESALPHEPSDAQRVDWSELAVVPGFIDAHMHVTTRGAGKLHEETEEDEERALAIGAANLSNALTWGVTTVRDAGSWDHAVVELLRRTDAGKLPGPRVMPAGAPLTTPAGHLHWFGGGVAGQGAIRDFIGSQAAKGMTHVKVMVTGGWATPGSDPRIAQFSEADLRTAAQEARRLGMHTMGHIAATEGVRRALAAGIDTLEHAMFQRPDGTWEYPNDLLDAIVNQNAWVDPTPAWHFRTVESPPSTMSAKRLGELREARASRMRVYQLLLERGHTRWLTGTDTGGTNPRDYFPLVCQIMADEIGLQPRAVLRAATSDAANALGLAGETGAVRPGLAADLVGLAADPAQDPHAYWKVGGVITRGRLVAGPFEHAQLDESVGGGWE